MAKTVWVLGAGFSRSLGAPLLADLFSQESLARALRAFPELKNHLPHANQIVKLYLGCAHGLSHNKPAERQWEHAEEFIERVENAWHDKDGVELANLKDVCARLQDGRNRAVPHLLSDEADALDIDKIHESTLRLLIAECCVFLRNADPLSERWDPYRTWAMSLGAHDTVLTFNYDCVPDLLASSVGESGWRISVPDPEDVIAQHGSTPTWARFLKLHGSTAWVRNNKQIRSAVKQQGHQDPYNAALYLPKTQMAIATPGHAKRDMVAAGGVLAPLWNAAHEALHDAERVIFVGYRIPPTDSYSRQWLAACLAGNLYTGVNRLEIHTVLGDDVNHKDSRRLRGIIKGISDGIRVEQHPMFAEDFLGVIAPNL